MNCEDCKFFNKCPWSAKGAIQCHHFKELTQEEIDAFWNVKIPWIGMTKWNFTVGFFLMGIISILMIPILFILIYLL